MLLDKIGFALLSGVAFIFFVSMAFIAWNLFVDSRFGTKIINFFKKGKRL
jgi:hypothetical protein